MSRHPTDWRLMLPSFRHASIKRKLMSISLISNSVALLLSCLGFLLYDMVSYRQATEAKLSAVAHVVANHTAAALVFDDSNAAEETLAALRAEQGILSACIQRMDGARFADYRRDDGAHSCSLQAHAHKGIDAWTHHFDISVPIQLAGEELGILTIDAGHVDMGARLARYGFIAAIVMLASGVVALFLASKLWGFISSPIIRLLETFRIVSLEKDYSLRVESESRDELGRLIDSFNEMLGQIQDRDRELQSSRDQLEEAVEARTLELSTAIEDLNGEITQREKAEERIRQLAYYDIVTGLPNRQMLKEMLDRALTDAARNKACLALVYLDLDHFKEVNDTLGHSAGDELLRQVSGRLLECVRFGDAIARSPEEGEQDERELTTVSRQGGDEFTILLSPMRSSEDASRVAERIVEEIRKPFTINNTEVVVGTSVGIAIYPDDGTDSETLIEHADTAMYHAKESGGNDFQYFTQSMKVAALRRVRLENDLRQAIDSEAFRLVYQPKFNMSDQSVAGVEALIRWTNPATGSDEPGGFIGVCEESGLIVPIGEWVLREACRQGKAWEHSDIGPIRVAVNVSGRQFRDDALLPMVERILAETELPPQLLELEVTETAMIEDEDEAVKTLRALKNLGVHISLDDFGTGYSSLNLVHRLPLDSLKVDGSFIRGIEQNADSRTIVRSIVLLGQGLGLEVVAEGVETEAQIEFLRSCGCNQIQGYWYMRPVPSDELAQKLRDQSWRKKA